jgi:hypothetical protein
VKGEGGGEADLFVTASWALMDRALFSFSFCVELLMTTKNTKCTHI